MAKPKVVSIVLNYNGAADSVECVNSLLKSTYPTSICLIDNKSTDDSVAVFARQKWGGKVHLIKTVKNLGYVGNNVGIQWALDRKADYVYIVNNDVNTEPDAIAKMAAAMQKKPKACIIAPVIVYHSDRGTVWSAGTAFNSIIFKASLMGMGKPRSEFSKRVKVPMAVGAAMLVRCEAIRKAGLMDERYFMYYEETQWQYRLKKAGYSVYLEPSACAAHKVAASTGGGYSPFSTYFLVRNRGFFINDCAPAHVKPLAYLSLVFEVAARIVLGVAKGRNANAKAALDGFVDFLRGMRGPRK